MRVDLETLADQLDNGWSDLRASIRRVVSPNDLDAGQVAANQLAWGAAHTQAARAALAWAKTADHETAHDIAEAAAVEALGFIRGASAEAVIAAAPLLERISETAAVVEEIGSTAEEQLLRRTFREFADDKVRPVASDIHRGDLDLPEQLITDIGQLGVFGLAVPSEYGGLGGTTHSYESMLIVTEELSRASLVIGSLGTRPEILVRALLRGGTEEQKARWLPPIASGAELVAVATTEPDCGSDVAMLQCRASRVDGGWSVTGSKLWCTHAGRADVLMLLVRTGDDGHRGLSLLLAEKARASGHEFRYVQPRGGSLEGRAIPTIGYRGMHTFELAFDNFFVPDEGLLGGEAWLNRGFYLQLESFSTGRLQTAARAVGVMQAAVDDARDYASHRRVFGRRIADFGLARVTIGRMIMRVAAARQLNRRAAQRLAEGQGQIDASLAKLYASRMAEHVTRDSMQLLGGMGYAEETAASRYFVDARVLSIFEGAEEVLATRVIARNLLEES